MSLSPIKVFIYDDHDLSREAAVQLITSQPDMVCFSASSRANVVEHHRPYRPDVSIISMSHTQVDDSLDLMQQLYKKTPGTRMIWLAPLLFEQDVLQARRIGAAGCLLRTVSSEALLTAIRQVHATGLCQPFDRQIDPPVRLTRREMQTLRYMAQGYSNRKIAPVLGVGEQTILTHVKSLLRKLRATNRAQAVAIAYERGYLRLQVMSDPGPSSYWGNALESRLAYRADPVTQPLMDAAAAIAGLNLADGLPGAATRPQNVSAATSVLAGTEFDASDSALAMPAQSTPEITMDSAHDNVRHGLPQ